MAQVEDRQSPHSRGESERVMKMIGPRVYPEAAPLKASSYVPQRQGNPSKNRYTYPLGRVAITAGSVAFMGAIPFGVTGGIIGGVLGAVSGFYDRHQKLAKR